MRAPRSANEPSSTSDRTKRHDRCEIGRFAKGVEHPVVIPDAFFRVVVKENGDGGFDVLSFLIPQRGQGTSVARTTHCRNPLEMSGRSAH
jgi:hypothetical protein